MSELAPPTGPVASSGDTTGIVGPVLEATATPLSLVPRVEPFLAAFAEGALRYAEAHGTKPERVSLLAALCLRESWACTAPGYRPKGSADGSGDWSVRAGGWPRRDGVIVHPDTDGARAALLAAGWSIPKKNGAFVRGPYATPRDGQGWGRGALQIDILGDQRALIPPVGTPWPLEQQAFAACAQLRLARNELAQMASGDLLEMAVRCRYNASLDRVRAGLDAGDPNVGTTGGDYGRDVAALEAAVFARWPDTAADLPVPPRSA